MGQCISGQAPSEAQVLGFEGCLTFSFSEVVIHRLFIYNLALLIKILQELSYKINCQETLS